MSRLGARKRVSYQAVQEDSIPLPAWGGFRSEAKW